MERIKRLWSDMHEDGGLHVVRGYAVWGRAFMKHADRVALDLEPYKSTLSI